MEAGGKEESRENAHTDDRDLFDDRSATFLFMSNLIYFTTQDLKELQPTDQRAALLHCLEGGREMEQMRQG